MTPTAQVIQRIPTDAIAILNPRARNKKVFQELVASIANLGLKKPITVSSRKDGDGYDLVCGQGRLEAFIALGQKDIHRPGQRGRCDPAGFAVRADVAKHLNECGGIRVRIERGSAGLVGTQPHQDLDEFEGEFRNRAHGRIRRAGCEG